MRFERNTSNALLIAGSMLVAAAVCGLPHLMGLLRFGADYTPFSVRPGVSPLEYDETHAYLPGPSRFMRDTSLGAERDVYELRSSHSAQPLLPSIVIGVLGRLTGSIEAAWIVCDTLFPALLLLLLYQIAGLACSSVPVRLAVSWFCLLLPFGPRNFFLAGAYAGVQPLEITRTPQPELSFPLLLLGCYLAAWAIEKGSWTRLAAAGAVLGLSVYAYYFYALVVCAALAMLFLAATLAGRMLAGRVLAVGAAAALVALPFGYIAFEGVREGRQSQLLARMGASTHAPSVAGLALLTASALGLAWLSGSRARRRIPSRFSLFLTVLLALLAAAGFGLNTQVATGYDPQQEHFWNRVIQPVAALGLCLIGAWLVERLPRFAGAARWAAPLSIGVMLAFAAVRQARVAEHTAQDHLRSSPSMELLEWARSHLPADAVVGATDKELILLIPAIAGTWNFVPSGLRSMASDDEIIERYLIVSRVTGRTWLQVERDLAELPSSGVEAWRNAGLYVLLGQKNFSRQWQDSVRARWEKLDMASALKHRKLDYLIVPADFDSAKCSPAAGRETVVYRNRMWKMLWLRMEARGRLTVARSATRP